MAAQKQDDQHERTFSSYVRIRDVVLKTYLGRWTIGRSGERGSGISMLPARYDDDDDSNCCCSCSFDGEIIKIGQSSHSIYSNIILNFQEYMAILNACTKKSWSLLNALRVYIYKVKLATLVEGNPKAPFSIATTPKCRGWCISIPWIFPLYPRSLPYNAEC